MAFPVDDPAVAAVHGELLHHRIHGVEEKIGALIASKRELAENVIGSGGEHWITELSNEELLSVLRLDP